MLHFITQLTSLLLAHSLLIGAGAFMLLRGALSRSLSAAIVERVCPPPAELPAPKRAYRGWRERFAHYVPDAIEDSVLKQAYRQRVAEQVRRKFLELVCECLFNLIIALGAYLTGWALTKTGLLTPDWLIFAVRLISLAIFVQTALRVWDCWDALSWRGIKAFYRDFGLNVVRFVEYQIASVVEAQAARAIEERVKHLGRVERAVYRWLGLGTDYYDSAVFTPGSWLLNPAALVRGLADSLPPCSASRWACVLGMESPSTPLPRGAMASKCCTFTPKCISSCLM